MTTRFLLVRHGQSEWNAQGLWQGQADPPLSVAGREEAALAAAALGSFDGRIGASPLIRARETAEIIAQHLGGGAVLTEPGLCEIDVGGFSGLTSDEIRDRFPDEWAALQDRALGTFPGGESREAFRIRVLRALDGLAAAHPRENMLVVTHGGVIGTIEHHLGAHPGIGVPNVAGRWFVLSDGELRVDGDRVLLANRQDS